MFKIIKNFNWIILSSFTCIFLGILTFLTFINEGFVPLTEKNILILLSLDIILLLIYKRGSRLTLHGKPPHGKTTS